MMKKCLCILLSVLCLAGCSSKSTVMHSFSDKKDYTGDTVSIKKRLDSFSQSQVYLKDNSAYDTEGVMAGQALVFELNGDDNPVIMCKNAYQEFEPGFLTRLLACAMVSEKSDIYANVTVDADIYQMDTSYTSMGLAKDDSITVKNLIYGASIFGKCDCMIPLAKYYSGSVKEFNKDLSEYLVAKGCEQTAITNIYGMGSAGQYTNIYDMYLILPSILSDQNIYDMLLTRSYSDYYSTQGEQRTLAMVNFLPYFYENGFGSNSGLNIIGGISDSFNDSNTEMLVLAQSAAGRIYCAFVSECGNYENTKAQMEIILSKILN